MKDGVCEKSCECGDETKQRGSEREEGDMERLLPRRDDVSYRKLVTFALSLADYSCCNMILALIAPFFPVEVSRTITLAHLLSSASAGRGRVGCRKHTLYMLAINEVSLIPQSR